MEVFWTTGYERASLDVLLKALGISKQSLYDTFGDKRALYLKALDHYRDQTLTSMRTLFASAQSTRDGFARLLLGLSAESEAQHARGCLLLSANLEREALRQVARVALAALDARLPTSRTRTAGSS